MALHNLYQNSDLVKRFGSARRLHLACGKGGIHTCQKLGSKVGVICAGADVNAKDEEDWTPLHTASVNGHLELARVLISAGADVNAKNEDNWTPLHVASFNGHPELARYLISAGADVNAKNDNNETPLYWASKYGHHEVVEFLQSLQAN